MLHITFVLFAPWNCTCIEAIHELSRSLTLRIERSTFSHFYAYRNRQYCCMLPWQKSYSSNSKCEQYFDFRPILQSAKTCTQLEKQRNNTTETATTNEREREEKSSNEMIINGLTRLPRLDDNIESVCN